MMTVKKELWASALPLDDTPKEAVFAAIGSRERLEH